MIVFNRSFKKTYKKRDQMIRSHFDERIHLFEQEPFHPLLDNHALHGKWAGYRSINVTGDFRAIFKQEGDVATFVDFDTHHNLYGT